MTAILDASAILAVLLGEPGHDRVLDALDDSQVSTVNLSEVVAKLVEKGRSAAEAIADVDAFLPMTAAFDLEQSLDAGGLRDRTRARGLSLGDRACLALARRRGARVLTADRAWADLHVGVEIDVIR